MFQAGSREAQLREMFTRLAGSDNEIDSEELQDILTASLSKGMCVIIIYCNTFFTHIDMISSVFSIDACRSMIAMLDVSIHPFTYPSIHLYIHPSIYISIHLFIFLPLICFLNLKFNRKIKMVH